MFRNKKRLSRWWLVLAIVLGTFIGGMLGDWLGNWLPLARMGIEIGNAAPFTLDTNLLTMSLQILARFNLGSLLGLLIGILVFRYFDR
jgi:uncharacterized membrane protein YfcA